MKLQKILSLKDFTPLDRINLYEEIDKNNLWKKLKIDLQAMDLYNDQDTAPLTVNKIADYIETITQKIDKMMLYSSPPNIIIENVKNLYHLFKQLRITNHNLSRQLNNLFQRNSAEIHDDKIIYGAGETQRVETNLTSYFKEVFIYLSQIKNNEKIKTSINTLQENTNSITLPPDIKKWFRELKQPFKKYTQDINFNLDVDIPVTKRNTLLTSLNSYLRTNGKKEMTIDFINELLTRSLPQNQLSSPNSLVDGLNLAETNLVKSLKNQPLYRKAQHSPNQTFRALSQAINSRHTQQTEASKHLKVMTDVIKAFLTTTKPDDPRDIKSLPNLDLLKGYKIRISDTEALLTWLNDYKEEFSLDNTQVDLQEHFPKRQTQLLDADLMSIINSQREPITVSTFIRSLSAMIEEKKETDKDLISKMNKVSNFLKYVRQDCVTEMKRLKEKFPNINIDIPEIESETEKLPFKVDSAPFHWWLRFKNASEPYTEFKKELENESLDPPKKRTIKWFILNAEKECKVPTNNEIEKYKALKQDLKCKSAPKSFNFKHAQEIMTREIQTKTVKLITKEKKDLNEYLNKFKTLFANLKKWNPRLIPDCEIASLLDSSSSVNEEDEQKIEVANEDIVTTLIDKLTKRKLALTEQNENQKKSYTEKQELTPITQLIDSLSEFKAKKNIWFSLRDQENTFQQKQTQLQLPIIAIDKQLETIEKEIREFETKLKKAIKNPKEQDCSVTEQELDKALEIKKDEKNQLVENKSTYTKKINEAKEAYFNAQLEQLKEIYPELIQTIDEIKGQLSSLCPNTTSQRPTITTVSRSPEQTGTKKLPLALLGELTGGKKQAPKKTIPTMKPTINLNQLKAQWLIRMLKNISHETKITADDIRAVCGATKPEDFEIKKEKMQQSTTRQSYYSVAVSTKGVDTRNLATFMNQIYPRETCTDLKPLLESSEDNIFTKHVLKQFFQCIRFWDSIDPKLLDLIPESLLPTQAILYKKELKLKANHKNRIPQQINPEPHRRDSEDTKLLMKSLREQNKLANELPSPVTSRPPLKFLKCIPKQETKGTNEKNQPTKASFIDNHTWPQVNQF